MKTYILIIEDRHADTTAEPFVDCDMAIKVAKQKAKEYCRDEEDYEEHDYGKGSGWKFYANYSCEGCCVRVVEVEMNESVINDKYGLATH